MKLHQQTIRVISALTSGDAHEYSLLHKLTVVQCNCQALVAQDIHECFCLRDSSQAGLDKMAQGHMLADVVAIIGECSWPSAFPRSRPQLRFLSMLT